jgi:membrane protein implicated in regulation of membrane protease activity
VSLLSIVFIAFAAVGCLYIVGAAMLGHLTDLGGDHGHAGGDHGDAGDYGVDHGGHGSVSAGHGAAAAFHFPFFSPLALATFFAFIGGYGLMAKHGFAAPDGVALIVAIPLALATAYVVTYGAWKVVQGSRGSSQIRAADLVGVDAEVLTPIPAGGVGEVAATVRGQRFTGPAREAGGQAVRQGAHVRVERMVGSTMVVSAGGGTTAQPR